MKKFTKILFCLMLCVFTFGLTACNDKVIRPNFDYDYSKSEVVSNGGLSVTKGDYIYFVNGYMSADDMKDKNANYTLGALMVAKLDPNGALQRDDKGLLQDEYCIMMSSKLAGFEASDLFILGDYLYFTSPCQQDQRPESGDDDLVWAKKRVDFNRIHLDYAKTGKGKVETLFQSQVENNNLEFKFYFANNRPYLLVYEKGANIDDSTKNNVLYRVDINNKNKVSEIARDVTSVVMDNATDENDTENIFYVQSGESTKLFRLDIAGESEEYGLPETSANIKVLFVGGGYVYIGEGESADSDIGLRRSLIANKSAFSPVIVTGASKNMYLSNDADAILIVTDNMIEYRSLNGNTGLKVLVEDSDATSLTYIGMTNGSVVYVDNNKAVKTASLAEAIASGSKVTPTTLATISDMKTDTDAVINCFDLNDGYLYFYKNIGTGMYLNRLQVSNNTGTEDEMIGIYLEVDDPTKKDEKKD